MQSYARVFISVKGDHRSRFSRSHSNLPLGSGMGAGGSNGPGGDGVSFADSEGTYNVQLYCN